MIEVKDIKKYYNKFPALKGLSFSVKKGEVLALLGPNGAGKTTTMRIITGFLNPSSGDVLINNLSIQDYASSLQEKIGYLPESAPLYPDMNVYEHLDTAASLHGINGVKKDKAINKVVDICDLRDKLYFNVSELSKGYKQRLGLAQALIHDPDILILDEPTSGLDPNQIIEIRKLIKNLAKNKTLIISTHIMQEVEAMASKVVLISNGELKASGSISEIMNSDSRAMKLQITFKGSQKKFESELKKMNFVSDVAKQKTESMLNTYTLSLSEDLRDLIVKSLVEAGLFVYEVKIVSESMENIFQELTK